jgi:hypothetical protein
MRVSSVTADGGKALPLAYGTQRHECLAHAARPSRKDEIQCARRGLGRGSARVAAERSWRRPALRLQNRIKTGRRSAEALLTAAAAQCSAAEKKSCLLWDFVMGASAVLRRSTLCSSPQYRQYFRPVLTIPVLPHSALFLSLPSFLAPCSRLRRPVLSRSACFASCYRSVWQVQMRERLHILHRSRLPVRLSISCAEATRALRTSGNGCREIDWRPTPSTASARRAPRRSALVA